MVLGQTTCKDWFCGNHFNLKDDSRPERPSVIDGDYLQAKLPKKPRTSVRKLAEELEVRRLTAYDALNRLGMRKKRCKWVPHTLTEKRKLKFVRLCLFLLSKQEACLFSIVLRRVMENGSSTITSNGIHIGLSPDKCFARSQIEIFTQKSLALLLLLGYSKTYPF